MLRDLVAVFERADIERPGQRLRGLVERAEGGIVIGEDAAVGAERQRAQAVPEQAAFDFGQRQHAHGFAAALGQQEMRAVPERVLDHPLPAGAVEKRRIRMRVHVGIPARVLVRFQRAHRDVGRPGIIQREGFGLHVQWPGRNTRSTRSHSKSLSSLRSLPGMRCRLT